MLHTNYDQEFPERKTEIKPNNLDSPWITHSLRKSSRKKQQFYEKFLKQIKKLKKMKKHVKYIKIYLKNQIIR